MLLLNVPGNVDGAWRWCHTFISTKGAVSKPSTSIMRSVAEVNKIFDAALAGGFGPEVQSKVLFTQSKVLFTDAAGEAGLKPIFLGLTGRQRERYHLRVCAGGPGDPLP